MRTRLPGIHILRSRAMLALAAALLALGVACSSATPTPPPTSTPEPTPTVAPNPTSTPVPVVVDTEVLDLASTRAFVILEEILEELGPRESATDQESAAARYLQTKLQDLGYETEIQQFIVEHVSLAGMGLTLITPQPMEFAASALDESGLGDVSGILTPVGLAMPGDIPEVGLEGRIAFAKRGVITFQSKAENVFEAGAVGLVIYNNVSGPFRGVLADQPEFPVISLSLADGEAVQDLLVDSEIEASIKLTLENLPSQNVIAQKPGASDAVVVLGGHFDSVPGLSGANDNASGTAVLLAIAELLADVDLPYTLRIVPFGSEELGLLGSRFYVQELSSAELENTKLMLNFDALSTGSGVAIFGDGVFTDLINEKGSEVGVDVRVSRGMRGGTSDFAVFREAGVPFVMFFGDDASRIHTELDTVEFVQPEMLGGAAAAAAALLQSPEFAELIENR